MISLIIIIGAINLWQAKTWQQTIAKKLAIKDKNTEEQKNDNKSEPNSQINKTTNNKVKPLLFIQIDLPTLPVTLTKKRSASPTAALNLNLNKTIRPEQKQQAAKDKTNVNAKTKQSKQTTTIKTVSAMYQQLISDDSINIEIAWPDKSTERESIFSYLYQCIGMQFGVLKNQKVTLIQNNYQNITDNHSNQASDWLRIAQGQLARQEYHWLEQYYLSGTPVRLFPKAVDWQLARLLTSHLKKERLQSLRARYMQLGNQFMLTNITLNGRLLTNDWTLITKNCPS
ncbi:hypothetical protein [Colwellia sp. TT2012]|uniref:hypothetical protein n=1 Tax=Colwellia sp. TT2012 TaxID=1720342 RepID=UPI0012F71FB4|nr:hypothetical protein [Colwellia sp. TT2012]